MATVAAIALLAGSATAMKPWMNPADDPVTRAKALVAEMNTSEKLALFHGSCSGYTGNVCGNDRLKIPQFKYNDGPQGFRGADGTSTSWPAALTVSTAWDMNLSLAWGTAMGLEFYQKGANVQLGPGACVARVPRNGRNFEYVSGEDPFFGYHATAAVVTGIQSQGVIANVKHFVNNNQETNRGSVSENVDERTQFEIYYPPFEGASNAGLGSIMCSYNKICYDCDATTIGNWSCENSHTLQTDFKERIGFKGYVMSDWGATHSPSILEGLDQEMPGSSHMGQTLAGLVANGDVPMSKVDDSAVRILWPFFAVGLMDKPNPPSNVNSNNVTSEAHNALARKISSESTVLLKNEGLLPIPSTAKTILVVGTEAMTPIVHGGGSGQVFPDYVVSPLDGIREHLGIGPTPPPANNCSDGHFLVGVDFFNQHDQTSAPAKSVADCCSLCAARPGCNAFTFQESGQCWMKADDSGAVAKAGVTSGLCHTSVAPSPPAACNKDGVCVTYLDGKDMDQVATAAKSADVVLVFVATSSHEGSDRSDLSLGDQDNMTAGVAAIAGKKTAVIVVTPGAILTPWRNDVAAVLTPMMPGQQYGAAIADILFGVVNPSGKLLVTFPNVENEMNLSVAQWPGINNAQVAVYSEKLNVGYRWYASNPSVKPAYPFGHGISYTSFKYSDLKVAGRTVSFTVENSGAVSGAEVPQMYLKFPDAAGEPPKQLKGFTKVNLAAGASTTVSFELDDRSFSIWDVSTHAWTIAPGSFGVMVGSSTEDIRLTGQVSP